VSGCTDPYADNYNPDATLDDGSCAGYPDNGEYSLSFDGVDDIISGTASSSLDVSSSNRLTIAAWVNPPSNETGRIFTHGNNTTLAQYALLVSSGKVYFLAGTGAFESGGNNNSNSSLTPDEWNFVTMTYDGTAVKIYINGALDFTHTVTDNFTQDYIGNFYLGARSDGLEPFNGKMDDIHIWNTALTQDEVQSYMATSPAGSETGLVGYWKFNAGEGEILYDHSGNANHGTIYGATWSNDIP
jgi:hypothetical protein